MQPLPKNQATPTQHHPVVRSLALGALAVICFGIIGGCAMPLKSRDHSPSLDGEKVLISGRTGTAVAWDEMLADLKTVGIVYVGEKHTSTAHHLMQLRVIRALHAFDPQMTVGMEMFDRTYQPALDQWSTGSLDEDEFLRRTHWYANWRFDFSLYRDILSYVKSAGIRLAALNLPFNIPPKIRVGGTEHLSGYEKGFLPAHVDTTVAAHREFAQKIFNMHDFKSGARFEDFYLAQCVWEDAMAESAAMLSETSRLVVLAGNGHIQFKYGIPERAFKRDGVPYRTIYQASPGEKPDPSIADYILMP